jgi:hypothetical protein
MYLQRWFIAGHTIRWQRSLCLLAQAYDLSFALVKRFSDMDGITVGFLMQVDKLVRLESPSLCICVYSSWILRAPCASTQSIYGLLMCLPRATHSACSTTGLQRFLTWGQFRCQCCCNDKGGYVADGE